MNILMHACCGPCSIVPTRSLKGEGAKITALFDNPNIQPYTEWVKRLEALTLHMERENIALLPPEPYDLVPWLRRVVFKENARCALCYEVRLAKAAAKAAEGGFDAFTTTLLYSRHQKHDLIRELGEKAAREAGTVFLYRDWRPGWSEGVAESKRLGMYRQQYCGCIYSEMERYLGNIEAER